VQAVAGNDRLLSLTVWQRPDTLGLLPTLREKTMRHQHEVRPAWRAHVGILLLTCLGLGVSVAPVRAGSITLNGFNNNTPATVTFDDGAGHSGSENTLLTQFNVTFNGGGTPSTFNTFSVDLFHTVSAGQTYAVTPRGDLATAFVNGSRIAYVFENFGLPNLQGRAPLHMGSNHTLGERGGEQGHTLSISEIPTHTHVLSGSSTQASTNIPANNSVLSASNPQNCYAQATNLIAMSPQAIGNTGGSQAHLNMMPFLVLNFSIALQGIFPSQT